MSKKQDKPEKNQKRKKKFSRRDVLKMGVMSGGAALVGFSPIAGRAQNRAPCPISIPPPGSCSAFPLAKWADPLPIPPIATPVNALSPAPTLSANFQGGEATRDDHQRWLLNPDFTPQVYYDISISEGTQQFHRDLPPSTIWGYNVVGQPPISPGPTFVAQYGSGVLVRFHNDLPRDHCGFGDPRLSTHLHNGHTPSESDGFPDDFYGPGLFKDHHYPNIYAGYDTFPVDPITNLPGDWREALATLWYHDHRVMFTAPNVYKGLAGFYLLYDVFDSGNENDTNPNALRLPSGRYDVPLIFQDKKFDSNCQLQFDQFDPAGFIGDQFAVNGKITPYFKVARRKYRFRLLNGGPSRWYEFFLSSGQQFQQIANDGNLLPAPIWRDSIQLGVAERVEVVIDFSGYNIGDTVYLTNRLIQNQGSGPDVTVNPDGSYVFNYLDPQCADQLLRFDVTYNASDYSQVPPHLRDLPDIPNNLPPDTTVVFNKGGPFTDPWSIRVNGGPIMIYNGQPIPALQQRTGGYAVWNLQNNNNPPGWAHPIHIHLEEFQILSKLFLGQPLALTPDEHSRKDVMRLPPRTQVRVFLRFREWTGRYPIHCHNTIHEDHAMMGRWDVVA